MSKFLNILKYVGTIGSYLVSLVFFILKLCGVNIIVSESEINTVVSGLAAIIGTICIGAPALIKAIKTGKTSELLEIVNTVVSAVEEKSKTQPMTSKEKLDTALETIESICKEKNIPFDAEVISEMIETVVGWGNKVIKGGK